MSTPFDLDIRPEITEALLSGRPVVALETTVIAHGLPWPINLETAKKTEQAVREEGAVPATIAVVNGMPTVGLSDSELEFFAKNNKETLKASRRDLAFAVVMKRNAATTVAATMHLAHLAGIRVLATGGIGGVHRTSTRPLDVSADLLELSRTPVVVVCSGGKSILDVAATLEVLETAGVPVLAFRTDEFPAFYVRSSSERVPARVDTVEQAAHLAESHWKLQGAGIVLAQPIPTEAALEAGPLAAALSQAEIEAAQSNLHGPALTPYLLARLAELTNGKTLAANQALLVANARLAAQLAVSLSK